MEEVGSSFRRVRVGSFGPTGVGYIEICLIVGLHVKSTMATVLQCYLHSRGVFLIPNGPGTGVLTLVCSLKTSKTARYPKANSL